jgi:hypothetical protein
MPIEGINTNYCKGKFVVFIKVEKKRYFYGAYKSFAQAQRIAYKIGGGCYFFE